MKNWIRRWAAMGLVAVMLLVSAFALTPEQLGELLKEYYVDDIPESVWAQDTVKGMIAALGDPYTEYLSAEQYSAFNSTMEDTRKVGLGVRGSWDSVGFVLSAVIPDSPAARAGIRYDDVITEIDGRPMQRMELLTMEDGEVHVFTVVSPDGESRQVTVTLGEYVYPTAFLTKVVDGVGYIELNTYGKETYRQVFDILTDVTVTDEVRDWVLDLRDNGGGNVYPAVFVPGAFLGNSSSLVEVTREGPVGELAPDPSYFDEYDFSPVMDVPENASAAYDLFGRLDSGGLFVLVDGESASAAEATARLAQKMGGVVIGERTYGKGVGQSLLDVDSHPEIFGEDALKVTSMKIYDKDGVTTHVLGVLPDFVVASAMAERVAALLAADSQAEDELWYTIEVSRDTGDMLFLVPLSAVRADPEAAACLLETIGPAMRCGVESGGALTVAEMAEEWDMPYESRWFLDVEESLYEEELNTLAACGILHGDGTGYYYPDRTIDRASLAALVVKAIGPRRWWGNPHPFRDVPKDAWYNDTVSVLYEVGWLRGDGAGRFYPDAEMSHQEFFTLMTRILRAESYFYQETARTQAPATDTLREIYPAYAEWALDSLWQAEDYAWAEVDQIDPAAPVTREEAGVAIYNMLALMGLL